MRRLGNYNIQNRIGEGGMGVVYRALDLRDGSEVALKLLHPQFREDESRRARFLREGEYAQSISHGGVVRILDLGEVHLDTADRTLFLCMELVKGRDLLQVISRETPQQRWVAEVGLAVAEALLAIEQAGIVHRDIKPGNILVTSEGVVKLMDFGLAYRLGEAPSASGPAVEDEATQPASGLTLFGSVVGTPGYAAPEQLRGEQVDARSDLYALGATLYQMLTGALPFSGTNPREILRATETAAARSGLGTAQTTAASSVVVAKLFAAVPGVSVRFAQLVGALMSAPMEQRPSSAVHVSAFLEAMLLDDPELDSRLEAPDGKRLGAGTSAWMRLKDWLDRKES